MTIAVTAGPSVVTPLANPEGAGGLPHTRWEFQSTTIHDASGGQVQVVLELESGGPPAGVQDARPGLDAFIVEYLSCYIQQVGGTTPGDQLINFGMDWGRSLTTIMTLSVSINALVQQINPISPLFRAGAVWVPPGSLVVPSNEGQSPALAVITDNLGVSPVRTTNVYASVLRYNLDAPGRALYPAIMASSAPGNTYSTSA